MSKHELADHLDNRRRAWRVAALFKKYPLLESEDAGEIMGLSGAQVRNYRNLAIELGYIHPFNLTLMEQAGSVMRKTIDQFYKGTYPYEPPVSRRGRKFVNPRRAFLSE